MAKHRIGIGLVHLLYESNLWSVKRNRNTTSGVNYSTELTRTADQKKVVVYPNTIDFADLTFGQNDIKGNNGITEITLPNS